LEQAAAGQEERLLLWGLTDNRDGGVGGPFGKSPSSFSVSRKKYTSSDTVHCTSKSNSVSRGKDAESRLADWFFAWGHQGGDPSREEGLCAKN